MACAWLEALAKAGEQSINPDWPVPRWSKVRIWSVPATGAPRRFHVFWARSAPDWPGPPASPIHAVGRPPVPRWRSTCSGTVPGTWPVRSSGTVTVAHSKSAWSAHGVKVTAAEAVGTAAARPAMSTALTCRSRRGRGVRIIR